MSRITRDLEEMLERRQTASPYWPGVVAAAALFLCFTGNYPRWVVMWTISLIFWSACKWATWWDEVRCQNYAPKRVLGYLFLWPGMNPQEFLGDKKPATPCANEWIFAAVKMMFGAVLVWGVVRMIPTDDVLCRGWTGLIGLAFLFHFGGFHLLALQWQQAGVNAQPIMRAPVRATSLAEFWNRRWNIAFTQLAHRFVFQPLVRRLNPALACLAVFLVSGLVHDVVISIPAGAGYGRPTAYFMVQGCAVLFERSKIGRRLELRHGWRGWLFVVVITVSPVFLLFHPPFIRNVILPMLTAIGATGR